MVNVRITNCQSLWGVIRQGHFSGLGNYLLGQSYHLQIIVLISMHSNSLVTLFNILYSYLHVHLEGLRVSDPSL